ncbi:MAG: HAD-IA family hydrolase [Pseudomonadota bacterium]
MLQRIAVTRDEIKGLRGLLFDKDGTLFGFQESWGPAFSGLLAQLEGLGADPAALAGAIGFERRTQRFAPHSPVIAGTPDDLAALVAPHVPKEALDGLLALVETWSGAVAMAPVTDLAALMSKLGDAGYALGVATNDAEAAARAHLGNLASRFGYLAGFDSGHGAKPGPGMVTAFIEAAGLAPHQVAMIGDSLHDLRAAEAAGARRIAVLTGVAPAQALAPHADLVLDSIADLPGLLEMN